MYDEKSTRTSPTAETAYLKGKAHIRCWDTRWNQSESEALIQFDVQQLLAAIDHLPHKEISKAGGSNV